VQGGWVVGLVTLLYVRSRSKIANFVGGGNDVDKKIGGVGSNSVNPDVQKISFRFAWELVCSVCREWCGGYVK